jgi:hypothetical protein
MKTEHREYHQRTFLTSMSQDIQVFTNLGKYLPGKGKNQ